MFPSQEFDAIDWSAEDDLLIDELVVRADRLLTSRIGSSAAETIVCPYPSDPLQQAVIPENALQLTKEPSQPSNGQADDYFKLPDLEDIGLVLDRRRFRAMGLKVTDFTSAEWCQQQFALALTAELPRVSSPTIHQGPKWLIFLTIRRKGQILQSSVHLKPWLGRFCCAGGDRDRGHVRGLCPAQGARIGGENCSGGGGRVQGGCMGAEAHRVHRLPAATHAQRHDA